MEGGRDVLPALARGIDGRAQLVDVARPHDDRCGTEGKEVPQDVVLGDGQQRHDRRMRPEPDETPDELLEGEVGGRAHHHDVGPEGFREAQQLAPGSGLGDDLQPAALEHGCDARPYERELVGDDGRFGRPLVRILHGEASRAVVTWDTTLRAAVFDAKCADLSTLRSIKGAYATSRNFLDIHNAQRTGRAGGRGTVKPTQPVMIDIERATHEDQLVRQHLPLVQYVVSEVAHRVPSHVTRNDLVSAGMLGLAQAARSYDPERGIAFERFASTRIRGALLDELRGRDWASRSVRARARGLQAAHEELMNKLGRAPTSDEVAATLDVPTEIVHKLVDDVHRATVLNYDSLVLEGDAESFIASDDATPEMTMLDRERKAYLMDAVQALPERLQRVVIGYFFEERSMQDLADELGVSESRISQLRAEALLLLKDGISSQLEPEALPEEPRPNGRVARRKAAYYAAVAAGSSPRDRVSERPLETTHAVTAQA